MQRLSAFLTGLVLVAGSAAQAAPSQAAPSQAAPSETAVVASTAPAPRTQSAAAKPAVTLKATERSITVGETLRLSGTVKAGLGTRAVVQRKVGRTWKTQARVNVSGGRYSYVLSPRAVKKHKYRVRVERSGRLVAARSKVVTVKVTRPKKRDLVTSELRNARVPSLCGHPAGRLRNGSLPGIREGYGEVTFRRAVFGELDGKRGRDAAVVIRCNAGGVGWPDHVLLYTANKAGKPTYRGDFDTSSVVKFSRESVRDLRLVARRVQVDAYAGEQWECMGCGTVEVSATLKLSKGKLKIVRTSRFGASEALERFLDAANRGDLAATRRLSEHAVEHGYDPATFSVEQARTGKLSPYRVYGETRLTPCEQDPSGGPHHYCMARNAENAYYVTVRHDGWKDWTVVWMSFDY